MNIREKQEKWEIEYLSEYACKSIYSKGRKINIDKCDIRTIFQRDRDRILHSKSFRRLKDKTQVFLSPKGDHYRTRLTHSLEVSQTARTISRALRLNEDLTEAIALGHDLGHTPFGHTGEAALYELNNKFKHNEQSVRVVEIVEGYGKGLNLSAEVIDGILNHQTSGNPSTLEGQVVRLSDKISYINSDIDDAIRAGILTEDKIPNEFKKVLGQGTRERLSTLIHDIVHSSLNKDKILMSKDISDAMKNLRKFMFKEVYLNEIAKSEENRAKNLIKVLYRYFYENFDQIPENFHKILKVTNSTKEDIICDYISGMTDKFAIDIFIKLNIPQVWGKK